MTMPITTAEINNIIKDYKQDSAPGPLGILNLLLKKIFKYTLEILAKVGNDILFNDIPHASKSYIS